MSAVCRRSAPGPALKGWKAGWRDLVSSSASMLVKRLASWCALAASSCCVHTSRPSPWRRTARAQAASILSLLCLASGWLSGAAQGSAPADSYFSTVRLLGVSKLTFDALRHRAHAVELRGGAPSLRWPSARPAYGCQAPGCLVLHGSQLLRHPQLGTRPSWLGTLHVTQVHANVHSTHAGIDVDLPCMGQGQHLKQ